MPITVAVHFSDWFAAQDVRLQVGVLAGAAALVGAVIAASASIANVGLKALFDHLALRRSEANAQRALYRSYADPLTTAADALFWRLNEILMIRGGYYLKPGSGDTAFEEYKVNSTQYRFAAFLGWLEALRRELVLSDVQPDASVASMRAAISRVRNVLADGVHVETKLVDDLIRIFGIDRSQLRWDGNKQAAERFGRELHGLQKRFLHDVGRATVDALSARQREALALRLAAHFRTEGGKVTTRRAKRCAKAASKVMVTREAWIFRDLQDAIGDLMLVPSSVVRRYDVKGYRDFMRESPAQRPRSAGYSETDFVLRGYVRDLIHDLDVEVGAIQDARPSQLRSVFFSIAALLLEFKAAEPARSAIGDRTLERAWQVLQEEGPAVTAAARQQGEAAAARLALASAAPRMGWRAPWRVRASNNAAKKGGELFVGAMLAGSAVCVVLVAPQGDPRLEVVAAAAASSVLLGALLGSVLQNLVVSRGVFIAKRIRTVLRGLALAVTTASFMLVAASRGRPTWGVALIGCVGFGLPLLLYMLRCSRHPSKAPILAEIGMLGGLVVLGASLLVL